MIKIAIVEDEELVAKHLSSILDKFFKINNLEYALSTFTHAEHLLFEYRISYVYDLIFMDINLPKMDGMTLANEIRKVDSNVMIVFVTSLAQYAIKGYRVKAFDFLLKPINYYDFELCMTGAIKHLNINKSIIIKTLDSKVVRINISFIKYVEAMDHTVLFHTEDGEYEERAQLKKYIDLFENESFIQCHKSFLVNLKYVKEIDKNDVVVDTCRLPISRLRRKEFIEALNLCIGDGGREEW